MTPKEWGGPAANRAAPNTDKAADTTKCINGAQAQSISSQQVAWFEVHAFVAPYLTRAGYWPIAGTPAWCALDDNDPVKWAAVLDAARHWALRVETAQQAQCEASRDISAAYDWGAIGQRVRDRREFYAAHPWLKRVGHG